MNNTYLHKVQYYETDKMGIVHHSNYIRFFEEARTDYFEKKGLGYDKIEELGLIIPVLGVECDYRISSTYGDTLGITVKLGDFNGIKFTIEYKITSKSGEILHVLGKTRHCFLDENFKPVLIKKTHSKVFEFMQKLLEEQIK